MAYRGFWLFLASMTFSLPVTAEEAASPDDAGTVSSVTLAAPGHNPDPWEKFNRSVFRFNDTLDRHAFRPVAKGYKKITPQPVRTGITNFFINLRSPIVVLNDLLQGKVKQAGRDTARFVVNSTVGIAGFWDVAVRMNLPANDEDFGQTLGVWGVKSGPYLVLPFMGPSSVRDTAGFGVDVLSSPRRYLLDSDVDLILVGIDLVNSRASLLDLESIIQGDRYLFIRDLYLQRREFAVRDGQVDDPFLDDDDFDDEPVDEMQGVPADPAEETPADESGVTLPDDTAEPQGSPVQTEDIESSGETLFVYAPGEESANTN